MHHLIARFPTSITSMIQILPSVLRIDRLDRMPLRLRSNRRKVQSSSVNQNPLDSSELSVLNNRGEVHALAQISGSDREVYRLPAHVAIEQL
jgi:hypothetical protein